MRGIVVNSLRNTIISVTSRLSQMTRSLSLLSRSIFQLPAWGNHRLWKLYLCKRITAAELTVFDPSLSNGSSGAVKGSLSMKYCLKCPPNINTFQNALVATNRALPNSMNSANVFCLLVSPCIRTGTMTGKLN